MSLPDLRVEDSNVQDMFATWIKQLVKNYTSNQPCPSHQKTAKLTQSSRRPARRQRRRSQQSLSRKLRISSKHIRHRGSLQQQRRLRLCIPRLPVRRDELPHVLQHNLRLCVHLRRHQCLRTRRQHHEIHLQRCNPPRFFSRKPR